MIPIAKPIIGEEEIEEVEKVLKSGFIAQGPKVAELKRLLPVTWEQNMPLL